MESLDDPKTVLKRYLQSSREALLWKLDGLSERELRLPRTGTGMNLLGIVKHMLNVEIGYFGDAFGRDWPTAHERVSEADFATDPQADWYATESESAEALIGLYRRVWTFADATIDGRDLDAVGAVPWWPSERRSVTLHQVLVHVLTDLARHAGHADILREQIDGSVGVIESSTNIPAQDWTGYVAKLKDLADRS
ncbi:MAG: DinB family protein [Marmoricola sp.]